MNELCECGCGQPAPIAPQTHTNRGWVKGEPMRFRRGHNNRGKEVKPDRWRVEDRGYETPCWVWQLGLTTQGYARLKHLGRDCLAHRVVYAAVVGDIPSGYEIDHMCRVRECVNPEHLRAVTHAQNGQNLGVRSDSRFTHRGVRFDSRRGSWRATVKQKHIGSFRTEEEAVDAARAARRALLPFSTN